MSREARNWAWESPVDDPTQLLILLSMADVASERGAGAFPSVGRLARDARCSERTVQRHLHAMVERDLLIIEKMSSRHRPTTYGLPMVPGYEGRHSVTSDNEPDRPLESTTDPTEECHRGAVGVTNDGTSPSIRRIGSGKGKESVDVSPDATRLTHLLIGMINDRPGNRKERVTTSGLVAMDRLLRLDNREPSEVERVIRWLDRANDSISAFWSPNIRSPQKLRRHWDQMAEQYRAHKNPQPRRSEGLDIVRAARDSDPLARGGAA